VDLGQSTAVKKVIIYNGNPNNWFRLSFSSVTLRDDANNILAVYEIGDASQLSQIDINAPGGFGTDAPKFTSTYSRDLSYGVKVKIQLEGSNYLHMREVKVYDNRDVNVAQNRPATQSSNMTGPYAAAVAGRAVDGNLTTISHTNIQTGKWPSFIFKLGITLSPLTLFVNF
jgi:hypothetical protein